MCKLIRIIRIILRVLRPTVLLIGTHPDDITYSVAGFAAKLRRLRYRVIEIVVTNGDGGSQDEARWPSHRIAQIRQEELLAANKILRIKTIFLNFLEGQLPVRKAELTAQLRRLIERFQPVLVITYGPDGLTGHKGHGDTSDCATLAFDQAGLSHASLWYIAKTEEWHTHVRPILDEYAQAIFPSEHPFAELRHLVLDLRLSARHLADKLRAMRAHHSQLTMLDASLESVGGIAVLDKDWFGREAFVPVRTARARHTRRSFSTVA
jgi:LmbE family N-acetylglucosaminyl deacetylase